jgi:UDP-N-acetylglucosamine 2-epimerase (non-hydrolysing)
MTKTICILAGARPNFIKVSPLVRAIGQRPEASCLLVYAGSADDPTLEPSLFDDLQIERPKYYLGVVSTSLNEITSQVMAQFDRFLDEHPVDVVIVVDDLASTMAAAIVTKKRGIRLAHLVAGTRSFDITMPKEINRLVIDALSDYLFTAGVRSTGVATREQSEQSQTYMVGNILMDTLRFNRDRLRRPASLPDLQEKNYLVFTLNRRALLADEAHLKKMLTALISAAGSTPVIAPLRPEAAEVVSRLITTSDEIIIPHSQFSILNSLSYLEFGWLTAHAKGVITDSGNVAEEATFNGVPCITLNNYTEHQETVSVGSNVLVGEDPDKLKEAVARLVSCQWKHCSLPERWDGRTAERILQILLLS